MLSTCIFINVHSSVSIYTIPTYLHVHVPGLARVLGIRVVMRTPNYM